MKSHAPIHLLILVFVSATILACGLFDISPGVNVPAPDFNMMTVGGRAVQLSQFLGKPVMLNFWATWCHPCLVELPLIQNRFEQYYPDLVVLAIEDGSTHEEIYQVAHEVGTSFLILRGTDEVLRQYNIRAFPTTFFIDADGIIRSRYVGELSPDQLDKELKKLGLE
jgi:thiol-disulfide isomerase/thioredoxin